ncbi:unnamed protein product [Arctia plantaginis]|uniref:Chitin-binding type-2 domain-containing protein n=1 Tax=Arctia plantaginis TaxID=874455 RepID=A0A8S0Z6Z8_ARCPL|nr:unnamed protein product [Arctia plantaginis]
MAHEFIDLKGFLFLVLITIPQTLSTNIDCGGKPFHCLNTTHFMICVDLGGGVSSTIDDFIIPCPPTTVCEKNNRFECEFPKIEAFTADLNVIGVSNGYDKSANDKTIPPDKRTTVLPLPEKATVTELPTKDKSMSSFNSEILEHLKDEFTGGNEKFFDEDIIPLYSVVSLTNKTDETSFVSPDIEKLITTTDKYSHTSANTSTNGVVSASRTDIPTLKDNKNDTDETSFVSPNKEKLNSITDKYPHTNANTSTNGVVSASRTDIPTLKNEEKNTDETSFVSPDIEKLITTTDKYSHTTANTSTNGVVSASRTDIPTVKDNKNNTDGTSFVSPNIEKLITSTDKYPYTNLNTSTNGVVSASRTDIPTLKNEEKNTDETSFVSPDIEKLITTTDKYSHTTANTSTNGVVSASRTDIPTVKDNKNNTDGTSFVSPNIEKLITSTDKYPYTNLNTSTNGVESASRTDIPTLKDEKNNTDETSFVSPDIEKLITTTDKYPYTNANTSTNGVVSDSRTDLPTLKDEKKNTDETSFVSPNIQKIITTTDKYPHTNANASINGVVSASRTDIPTFKDNKNNTDETSFVSSDIEQLITTTDEYPHTNANSSTNTPLVTASRTDIPTLKDNITYTEESKTGNNYNTGNKFNTTKKIGQSYVNELNQTIDKFIGLAELTNSLPNSTVSIRRIYNINLDPDNSSYIYQSQNLDLQKKIFKTVPISRNVNHLTTDTLSTSEKVVSISSKYNATDIVDNQTAIIGLTLNPNTTATNYSVEPETETEKLRTDYAYSPILKSVTANSIGITTRNMTSNTSGKDLPKLKETDTSTKALIIINELYNSNKRNTTNKIDQNNINRLNRTLDNFIIKSDSTTSQDLFNVSGKLKLQQKVHNPDLIPVTDSEMIFDALTTTEPGLVTSPKYNGNDNVDYVIVSEAVVRNSLPVKTNSTVSNYIVKSVSEVLKNDDEHKDVLKPVTASPAEKSTAYSILSFNSGTTNSNLIFAEVTNINRTFYSSDKHETLQDVVTTNLSIKPVKQSVLESLSTNDSNSTMQDSNGLTFKMKKPHTLVNDVNKIGFRSNIEIKSKENVTILNEGKIKVGINKTKEDYFPTKGNIDQMIIHNMKPTAFQTTLLNNNQTSATESPITSMDEQIISTGDNYTHNLNLFVETKVQSVPLQESISYYTQTIEKPKTIASPLVNHLTTFDEISLGISLEPTTTIDFIQHQSNHTVTIHNVSIDLEVESSSSLPTITSININVTNKATQNTTPVLQSEAVTYTADNSSICSATAEINKTLKTVESNDTHYQSVPVSNEYPLPTPNNTAASEQVSNLRKLLNSVNLTLLIGQKDDVTLLPLESMTENVEVHKQNITNIMETTTELDGTRRYHLITESVTESIYSANMSATTPSRNDIVVSTQPVMEYTKDESTLNEKEGNTITPKSKLYAGLLNSSANSLFHALSKTNESNHAPTTLVTDVSQDIHLSLNNEGKTRNNITTATVIDIIELDTGFGESKLLTSNATTKKPPTPDVTQSTQEAITHELDSISALPTPVVLTDKKQPNIVVNYILSSTMASIGQYNKDELVKVAKQTVNSNLANSTEQIVINDLDSISTVPTPNEKGPVKKQPSILVNRSLLSTMASISQPDSDDSGKDKTRIENSDVTQNTRIFLAIDSDRTATLSSSHESTAKKEPNITVKRILLSNMTAITQPNIDNLGNLETPIGNLNISESTRQTVANNLDSTSLLLTPSEYMTQKKSNTTVNGILPSTSLLNTDGLDKVRIQVESSNITQTTRQTVDSNFHSTSILLPSKESFAEKQQNISVNVIVLNTLAPISKNNTDDIVKFGTQIVSSKVTRNTQQIIGNDFGKASFNVVTEPAAVVETINDPHNIVGRPILSDMILSDIICMNETTNLKSSNQLNIGMPNKITEKATLYEKLQNTTVPRNASNDLNKREDLNVELVKGTFIDRQINIELSGSTKDNETSEEKYESLTAYNKIATLVDVTSPSSPVNNKSVNNAGYSRSAMDLGRPGYMSNIFSDLTQNSTLLNKMEYIYNSTNNTEAKVKKLTGDNILSYQNIKQLYGSAVSQNSNINISISSTNQMSNKSKLITVMHLLASANANNPPTTINANKEKNPTFTVDCLKLPRGKYADNKDCRKFYICIGKVQPIVGTCSNNTVFSEINKHCTKNLSHCVRNNQFHCLYEGRFSDFLRDNIYYICVKNNLNGFLRYKLQCQNGFHLNKAIAKCEKNEIWNQSDTSVSNSSNVSNDRNRSVSNSETSESPEYGEFDCKKEGKLPYPKNFRKYYVCTKNSKNEYRRMVKSCSSEEIYDKKKKKCVSSDSNES